MAQAEINRCTIAHLQAAPRMGDLLTEYEAEARIDGLPACRPQWAVYEAMERAEVLQALAATRDGALIGFLVLLLVPNNPHYGVPLAVTESFFVAAEHRRTGAGLMLLAQAEAMARERGAAGLLVSAPLGGRLDDVLPRVGYRLTNRVFFRGLGGAA